MSRSSKLLKNTMIISIGTFLPKLASFLTLPILTGCLSKTEYGTYDLITVLVSFLLPAATLQIQAAAFRFLINVRDDEAAIKKVVSTIVLFLVLSSLWALIILFLVLHGQSFPIRIFICLYFLVDIVVNAARQVCRGIDRNLDYSISAIVSAFGKMALTVILVYWLKLNLLGAVISLFVASFISLIYLIHRSKLYKYIDLRAFDKEKLKEMLAYSWPMVPNSMSAWIMRVSDRLVVTAVMGVSMNAVYAVANKLPSLLNLAQSTFTLAWQENASIVSRDEDASEYYSAMFRMVLDLSAGIFGVLMAFSPLLFRLLVRGDYSEAFSQMPILFVAMYFYGLSTFLGGIYVAFMKTRSVGITTLIAATMNLVVDLGTIKWIGLYAASGSTLVSYVFLFVYRLINVQSIIKVRFSKKHIILVTAIVTTEAVLSCFQKPILNIFNVFIGLGLLLILNRQLIRTIVTRGEKIVRRKLKDSALVKVRQQVSQISQDEDNGLKQFVDAQEDGIPPVLFSNKLNCCGCSACHAICPTGAITMEEDKEGFLYPRVNHDKCVKCYRCLKVCSFKVDQMKKGFVLSDGEVK